MTPIPWHYRCLVVAPGGNVMPGTEADSRAEAIRLAFSGHDRDWPYAVTQGYGLRWVREVRDT